MKKFNFYLSIVLTFAFFVNISTADAQRERRTKNDEYFDESGNFASRLWYGGGFNLGFTGNNAFNIFGIGISPMVGYKILENISIGPRASFNYTHIKGRGSDNQIHKIQPIDFGLGAFGRFKVIENFFGQVEFEWESVEQFGVDGFGLIQIDNATGEPITVRQSRENFYIGAGYSSGGLLAYEIMILYNTAIADDDPESPFNYRFGFTYNF